MPTFRTVNEQSRVYVFPNQQTLTVEKVVAISTEGTTHRLETADGRKLIVNSGWLAINIITDSWSF